MADDIRELNALIADYGREFQSPDLRRGPSLGSSRLYADYQPATFSEQVEMVLSMLPGIGEGLDAAYIAQGIEEKDLGKAGTGLAALLLPGVGAGVIKKIGENLPKNKQGLKSINIDDELFKDVLKTPEGDPVILYRGSGINDEIADATLSGKSRDNYATFMSDSPYVAGTYARSDGDAGVVTPFIVKPKKVIEYEDRFTRQNKVKPGSAPLSFDIFEFDRQAQNLGPGEVLVGRNLRDLGPVGRDFPENMSSYSDIYATKDSSVLQSPFSAKEVKGSLSPDKIFETPKPTTKADKPTRRPDGSYRYKEFDIVKDGKEYRFSHPSDEGYELSADTLDDAQTQIDEIFEETFGEVLSDEKATGWLKNHGYDPYVGIGPRPQTPYYEFTEDGAIKTYTPYGGNKSGVEVKTFRNPTRKQLRDWMGYKSGGRVERNPYNHEPKAI